MDFESSVAAIRFLRGEETGWLVTHEHNRPKGIKHSLNMFTILGSITRIISEKKRLTIVPINLYFLSLI